MREKKCNDPIRDAVEHLESAKDCLDQISTAAVSNMDLLAKAHIVAATAILEVAAANQARARPKAAGRELNSPLGGETPTVSA